jgi:hypothetical protein
VPGTISPPSAKDEHTNGLNRTGVFSWTVPSSQLTRVFERRFRYVFPRTSTTVASPQVPILTPCSVRAYRNKSRPLPKSGTTRETQNVFARALDKFRLVNLASEATIPDLRRFVEVCCRRGVCWFLPQRPAPAFLSLWPSVFRGKQQTGGYEAHHLLVCWPVFEFVLTRMLIERTVERESIPPGRY